MNKPPKLFRPSAVPDAALRRLNSTPSYFFLFWRWSMWLYAFIVILFFKPADPYYQDQQLPFTYQQMATALLTITFLQTLAVTLYAPVFQVVLARFLQRFRKKTASTSRRRRRRNRPTSDEDSSVVPPLAQTRNSYWNAAIYALDVVICGLVVYYSGPFTTPPFGVGSPFYRYGMSTGIAAALVYRYRGGLAAALGFDLFIVLGIVYMAPGAPSYYVPNVIDIAGSLIDAPVAAILAAYMITLLGRYANSKKREQEQGRHLRTILRVSENLMKGKNDQHELLQQSVTQIRRGGHFDRLVIALITHPHRPTYGPDAQKTPAEILTCVEAENKFPAEQLTGKPEELILQVVNTDQDIINFEPLKGEENAGYGIARLYLRIPKESETRIVIGAESRRKTPFKMQEELLRIVGGYLLVAVDNLQLTEQASQLAAAAERGRIARDIHDGIAQLTYMLRLQAETCSAQAQRIAEASEEDAELLTPLIERLNKMVIVSKQALWETRNYMFSLKPLMSGQTTLTQMFTNQLREFEAISDLPAYLHIQGTEEHLDGDQRRVRRQAQVGAALFRIVQEALTNAYKHAEASRIDISLKFEPQHITLEVSDNGQGLPMMSDGSIATEQGRERIYSGYGLNGMRERAQELGGTFDVSSSPAGGVTICASIPL